MASFVIDCPTCQKAVTASDELVGRVMACPHCSGHFTITGDTRNAVAVAKPSYHPTGADGIRFTFTCQRCASILEARSNLSGTLGRCPTCGAVFSIPQVDPRTGLPTGPAVVAADGQLPTPMHAYATAGAKAPVIKRIESGEQVIVCPRCDRQMPVDANSCTACGMPFTMDGAAAVAHSVQGGSNSYATASVAVGAASLAFFCFPVPILGPIAIILAIRGYRDSQKAGDLHPGRTASAIGFALGLGSTAITTAMLLL